MSALPLLAEPVSIVLESETDFAGFRIAARRLLAQGVAPEAVMWFTADAVNGSVFAKPPLDDTAERPAANAPASVPRSFIDLCASLALHADPQRFALMYRLLWRLGREPALRHDPIDADRVQAEQMVRAVRRDMHKTKAFVRFRPLDDGGAEPLQVAWFEPFHHTIEAVAPFFVRRFTGMRWAILTPRCSVRWQPADSAHPRGELQFGPGARREDAPPADAGEALWLTYYRNIFNPARLKMAMMKKEMPPKYWANLPEAALITSLAAQAMENTGRMVDQATTTPQRIIRPLLQKPAPVIGDPSAPPDSLAALRERAQRCRECPIGAHATQAVCGEGPLQPALMFVGEQPGDQEDLRGRPFVGPAGQLFDRALGQLGLPRESIFIANAVKHFKFDLVGKRRIHKTPTQREALACSHWLEDEIRLVQPAALVALGATAARALVGEEVAVTKTRGQWIWRADGLPVLVTLHPSALLRTPPADQPEAFAAWLADLRRALASPARSS